MNAKSAVLATAAAALFAAGVTVVPATATAASDTVKCHGVNACKGQTDCGAATHDCSGKNSCKGKGWKKMTKAECERAKEAMNKS